MTKTSFETHTEQDPTTNITDQVDEALGYDYKQLREDASTLALRAAELIERLRKIPDSNADPRVGSLELTEKCLVDAGFHLHQGDHFAHPEDTTPSQPPL